VTAPHDEPLPFGEDLDELTELSEHAGLSGLAVPEHLVEEVLHHKTRRRRVLETTVSVVAFLAMFAVIIPRLFDASYADVLNEMRTLTAAWVAVLVVGWLVNMATYWSFLTHALPGLRHRQGAVVNLSGSALANTIPFGGAVGIGATFAQCLSWGFDSAAITLSVIVSGVWNVLAKLAFPIVVVIALVVTRQATGGLGPLAIAGLVVVVVLIGGFAAVERSELAAVRIGRLLQRVVDVGRRLTGRHPAADESDHSIADRVVEFRHRTSALIRRQWAPLTVWMALFKVTSALLEVLCVRALGYGADQIGTIEIVAAYTLGELLTTIPLTPSGIGFVEAGNAGLLVYFGLPHEAALAAVLLFRAFDFLFEIPLGAVGWIVWAGAKSWRKPPGTVAAGVSGSAPAR
jgi:uncharacterized protein (TIRG00374 family)